MVPPNAFLLVARLRVVARRLNSQITHDNQMRKNQAFHKCEPLTLRCVSIRDKLVGSRLTGNCEDAWPQQQEIGMRAFGV